MRCKLPSRENRVHKVCKINMSTKKMADLLYATIQTDAMIKTTYGVGIYEYTRSQNSYNSVELILVISESEIPKFEELSGIKLSDPTQITIN